MYVCISHFSKYLPLRGRGENSLLLNRPVHITRIKQVTDIIDHPRGFVDSAHEVLWPINPEIEVTTLGRFGNDEDLHSFIIKGASSVCLLNALTLISRYRRDLHIPRILRDRFNDNVHHASTPLYHTFFRGQRGEHSKFRIWPLLNLTTVPVRLCWRRWICEGLVYLQQHQSS